MSSHFDLNAVHSKLSGRHQLKGHGTWPAAWHQFDSESSLAVVAALATGRPLLIRGEPGIGKSQIARAVAQVIEVPFLSYVVNATCECNDLLYSYDAVSRLAQAQVMSAQFGRLMEGAPTNPAEVRPASLDWKSELREQRFIRPQTLWWAINWEDARTQVGNFYDPRQINEPLRPPDWQPGQGCVVLIDEIDKADSDLPNGLLESLGNSGFQLPHGGPSVGLSVGHRAPLVFITTNEERELPAAFLRRCVVLPLEFPSDPRNPTNERPATDFLIQRGRSHFNEESIGDDILRQAAEQVLQDRKATPPGQPKPGAAEYLDLLQALAELEPNDASRQQDLLGKIAKFVVRKYQPEFGQ